MAWVIWLGNKGFYWILAILMLVDTGRPSLFLFSFENVETDSEPGLDLAVAISSSTNSVDLLTSDTLDWVRVLSSLAVNGVATLSIGYRGW